MGSDAMTIRAATSADTATLGAWPRRAVARARAGPCSSLSTTANCSAAVALSTGAVLTEPGKLVADAVHRLRRRRYQLLRQNGDVGTARSLLRRPRRDAARGVTPHHTTTRERKDMRRLRFSRIALLAVIAGLVCAAGAYATVIGLPADGSQVNNDPANGIDPNQNAGVSDVVGGSLAANGPRVPWADVRAASPAARSRSSCARSRTASG